MKILTEYKTKENTNAISTYGITIKNFRPGEAVGIYLRELYPATMDLINDLLYFKHPLTLKYGDVQYKLYSLDDWKMTYQDPKDQIKTRTDKHPILQAFLDKKKEYVLNEQAKEKQQRYNLLYLDYPELEHLTDEALDIFLNTNARAYEIYPSTDDKYDKLLAYIQVKYYMENGFEPTRELPDDMQIISFGDMTYLNDIVYKCKNSSKDIDTILQDVV
jgi:hypothetical protein